MESHGLKVGTVIQISTDFTKYPVPARIGECYEEDRGSGIIRLDRFLRTATKAKINQQVEIQAIPYVAVLESVTLMPPIDVTTAHHLIEHLQEGFIANRTLAGLVVYAVPRFGGRDQLQDRQVPAGAGIVSKTKSSGGAGDRRPDLRRATDFEDVVACRRKSSWC
jgi:hypothetical protein